MTPAEIAQDIEVISRDELPDFISDLITPARTVGWILTGTAPVYVLWIDGTFGILDERALATPPGAQASIVIPTCYRTWRQVMNAYRYEGEEAASQMADAALGALSALAKARDGYFHLAPQLRNEAAAPA